jgi:hypothetical protein
MKNTAFALIFLFCANAFAVTQTVKQDRLRQVLTSRGIPSSQAALFLAGVANTYYYDTYAELAAATPTEGTFGWARDTNAMYYYTGAAWTAVLSASSAGLLGTNSGTIGNEVDKAWAVAEDSETFILTFSNASNTVTLSSGTGATFVVTPATAVTGDLSLNGGAGALTVSGSGDSTLVAADADSTAFCMGAAGALDLVCLDTTDASPSWDVKGVVGQVALHVDAGLVQIDEDLTLSGGAAALTFDAASSAVIVPDNSATGLILGSSGLANLLTLDTRTGVQQVMVTGTTTQVALNVATGLANFAELVGIDGAAGALTFTNTAASIVLKDADASALDIGSAGRTDLMRFITTDNAEQVAITGTTATVALSVPVGQASFVEGVNMPIPAMALHEIRFCGNAANGNTAKYIGPILEADMGTDMTFGAAGCDGNDSNTETDVDDAPIPFAYKPVAMTCILAAGGTDDVVTIQMREDTSDVTGLTCNVTVDGAAAKQCTVRLPAPETVSAGSLVDVKTIATDDDLSAVDMECRVYVTF